MATKPLTRKQLVDRVAELETELKSLGKPKWGLLARTGNALVIGTKKQTLDLKKAMKHAKYKLIRVYNEK